MVTMLELLPSKYDFPALATSLEKLVKGQSLGLQSIAGTDDEANQQQAASSDSPKPIEMPFKVGVKGGYDNIQNLISVFERSIRPFNIAQLSFTAGQAGGDLTLEIDAKTYYQPETGFEPKSQVVK